MQILKHILLLVLINKIRFLNGDQLLNDFLQVKTLRYAHIINCDDDYNNVKLYNSLKHVGASVIINSLETCCRIKYIHHKTAFFLDADCFGWKQLIQEMAQNGFFNSTCHWLIKSSNYTDIESELSQLPLNIDSEVTIAIRSSDFFYNLYEVYNSGFNHYGTFNMTKFGYWKKETGILSLANQYKYLRRANMTGVVLKCMIVVTRKLENEMFEDYIQRVELTHIDSMNRFNFALLLHLRDIYNFSFNMMRTKSWGYLHNGTFDGMVGSLQKKEADIGGAPIFFRSDRAKVIDYTTQTWTSRPCFIFRHPKEVGSFYNIYTRPLDDYVWYSTLGLIALIAIALRYLLKENKKNYPKEDIDTSWSYTGLAVLSAICQQGLTIGHSSTTIRLTLYMAFIFALTMYQFYSASIVSSLLMEAPRNIRTLEDLLNSPLKAGIEDILYNIDYFSRTTDPVALELYRAKIKTTKGKNYFSASDGLAMVKKGGFAFHVDIATAYKIIRETFTEREICELVEVQLFPPQRMVAIVQKGSPFRKMVTYGLRKIAETGLMHRQRLLWHESKPKCIKTPDSTIFAVSIYEFSMALMVLFCGMMLSLVILMMEIIMHRRTTKGSILDNCFDKVKKVKSIDVRRKLRKPF